MLSFYLLRAVMWGCWFYFDLYFEVLFGSGFLISLVSLVVVCSLGFLYAGMFSSGCHACFFLMVFFMNW